MAHGADDMGVLLPDPVQTRTVWLPQHFLQQEQPIHVGPVIQSTAAGICRRCWEAVCDSLELDRTLPYDRRSKLSHGKRMPTEPYNYELSAEHPKLLTF